METFERWWERVGKYFDPDTEDVSWFDKRKFLAEKAFNSAESDDEPVRPNDPAKVLEEVSLERMAQDEEWGGAEHDDTHTKYDWAEYIRKHNNRALSSVTGNSPDASYRKQIIRVAALAVAAVQSFDRKKEGS